MNFRETLSGHLEAVQTRNLNALTQTLPPEGPLLLIFPKGNSTNTVADFIEFHRKWFADTDWTVAYVEMLRHESSDLGTAIIRASYTDKTVCGDPVSYDVWINLVFRKLIKRWCLVQDQNTIIDSSKKGYPTS